ncbi:unnamed protein product [Chironomus riparius]|uniref:Uncharacterized protein n=1 Tax=Chironomus riparius TaxID=315576 RepID=A0A9N9RSA1_9DIPT|nr:unnamed protein product [Chironomus riparius]
MKFTRVLLSVVILLVLLECFVIAIPTPSPHFPFTVNQKRTASRKKSEKLKPKRTRIVIDTEDVLRTDIKNIRFYNFKVPSYVQG